MIKAYKDRINANVLDYIPKYNHFVNLAKYHKYFVSIYHDKRGWDILSINGYNSSEQLGYLGKMTLGEL